MESNEMFPADEIYAASASFTSERGTRKSRRKDELLVEVSSHKEFMFSVLFCHLLVKDIVKFYSLAVESDGMSFLFAYSTIQVSVCLPIMMSQFILGQYGHAAFIRVWAIAPVAYGVGYSMMVLLMLQAVTNSTIFTSAFIISTYAFSTGLPWENCSTFESDKSICIDRFHNITLNTTECCTQVNQENCTVFNYQFSALHYFHKIVIPAHGALEEWKYFGALKLDITIYNMILWISIALVVATRMQNIFKLIPVVLKIWLLCHLLILILLLTQSGANIGFQELFAVTEQHIFRYTVWTKAFTHVVSSWQLGNGVLILLSSFIANGQVRHTDSSILSVLNVGLAIFFTVIYFCAYGILSQTYKLPLSCFIVKDHEALFALMPEALHRLPVPELWTIIFFVPIVVVSFLQTAMLLTASINGLVDQFPILKHYKSYLAGLYSFICLLLSLPLASQACFQILRMVESYLLYECMIIVLILYVIFVNLIYGVQRLLDDFHFMTFCSEPEFLHVLMHFSIFPVLDLVMLCVWTMVCQPQTGQSKVQLQPTQPPGPKPSKIYSFLSFPPLLACDNLILEMCYAKYTLMAIFLGPVIVIAIVKYVEFAKQENLAGLIKITSSWGPQEKSERNARLHFNPKKSLCYKDPLGNKCKHNCLLGDPSLKLLIYRFEREKEKMLNLIEQQKKLKQK